MLHATVLSCVKHGIGDEITLVGSLIAALIRRGFRVRLTTHHPLLYRHEKIEVAAWTASNPMQNVQDAGDVRVCFDNPAAVTLPLQFDVTPAVRERCRALGYLMIAGMANQASKNHAATFYDFAGAIIDSLGLELGTTPWPFLQRPRGRSILLNPFGNDHLQKGMPRGLAWNVLERILESHAHLSFLLPLLDKMPQPPPTISNHPNVQIERFEHGDPALLERYLTAAGVITAEGGGYHLAKAANIPALLVTSRQWYAQTRLVLPPGPHELVLFEQDNPESTQVIHVIRRWLDRDCP